MALEEKLEAFISKYYKNELLKGILFFLAIGLTYVLLVLIIEYFFWLNKLGRGLLFWSFVGLELVLLIRFIFIPLFRLFRLSKGIDYNKASVLIGNHFPEVRDKLINTLQLKASSSQSDLLAASIAQKSKELEPIPFSLAVDYKSNARYIKYALIPVLIFAAFSFSKGTSFFSESAERVWDYKGEYVPPAPFNFELINPEDRAVEGQVFEIATQVSGNQLPEEVQIELNGQEFFMKSRGAGRFVFTVDQVQGDLNFQFKGNGVTSRSYEVPLVQTPVLTGFDAQLSYPAYLRKPDETISNTGSFTVPEGTRVTWKLTARNATVLEFISDTVISFNRDGSDFTLERQFFRPADYAIATSNSTLKRYEELNYHIDVVRDAYPELNLERKADTTGSEQIYFKGSVSDDHGLRSLKLVYYIENQYSEKNYLDIPVSESNIDQFYAAFPGKLNLEQGKAYTYFFEVRDNDALNGFKATRSASETYNVLTDDRALDKQLEIQEKTLKDLDKSVSKMQERQEKLQDLQNLQKEKIKLDFNDRKKLQSFFERQKAQEELMKNYSETLKKSLERMEDLMESPSPTNELLKKRLEKNEEQLREQEKLMEEMAKLQELMDDEELSNRLDELSKNSKNSSRSMQQLLELTKRFFVQTKGERLGRELNNLGQEQAKEAAPNKQSDIQKQKELSESFKDINEEIEDLRKENSKLQKPLDMPQSSKIQDIQQEQKEAEDALEKNSDSDNQSQESSEGQSEGKKSQKKAGEKMQKLGQQMMQSMSSGGGGGSTQQLEEDIEMLRQILDNLIVFSFDQEALKDDFGNLDNSNPLFSKYLVKQNTLRENFQHIDDSLFVLALRNPFLEEDINAELTEISYGLNQALERLAENEISKGLASQQYVFKGANTLADMLSDILDNMQGQLSMSMGSGSSGAPMPSPGSGGDKQLSDIIMSQEELAKKLGEGKDSGDTKGNKPGDNKEGDGKNSGEGEGSQGDNGTPKEGSNEEAGGKAGEAELARQYEIYKQQEDLRNRLQDLIQNGDLDESARDLLKQMEDVEESLLSGNSENARRRMENLIQQFLKLEDAEQEKERRTERESNSNKENFTNDIRNDFPEVRDYFNTDEILNRDELPLKLRFKQKVKNYFDKGDD
ncbi:MULTISPECIES: hypothetical protein [unclassified Leeuwenhoekiella]|uniref:hypothetical protein n=1 Tax=unclassified Leeuwenhoekiella TaxID=2615029 RepID=UPI000C446828|nr:MULTISPECIES: hypothetical protein [unclassified Leeuwenhoekiella]MAW95994.1 hypothetical protein [Leeuwenhoekiella sp.]MBA79988.1 hypothetical protein [Leeuwenhoekiella sp.]|tara:strand:- start:11236 stop:14637 length:3402 start_codon:yes stop_codon:yes gene_type:complete